MSLFCLCIFRKITALSGRILTAVYFMYGFLEGSVQGPIVFVI